MKKAISLFLLSLLMISSAGCGSNAAENVKPGPEDTGKIGSRDAGANGTGAEADSGVKEDAAGVSLDAAKRTALDDAGVREADAVFTKEKTDYEEGHKVYDLEFYTSEAEYEYEIKVSDGTIFSRNVEKFAQNNQNPSGGAVIDLEQAKAIALEHARVSESTVTFKETKKDIDDGIEVYEIEFFVSGKEYEYKIRVSDGSILEYDID